MFLENLKTQKDITLIGVNITMLKKTKDISINILSVCIILVCLLLSCVGSTNAWFTSEHDQGVEIIANVGDLKLKLYQNINDSDVEILTNQKNAASANKQYVQLNSVIAPDTDIDIVLKIANEDLGSTSMYLRYKFELFSRGVESDTLIPCEISGYTKPTEATNGFTYNESEKYYYYTDNVGNKALFQKGASALLMESFQVKYSNFIDADGDFKLVNSDALYVKLTIDASVTAAFA